MRSQDIGKYLLIKLTDLQLKQGYKISEQDFIYYSFSHSDHIQFSSAMDQSINSLQEDIILPLNSAQFPQYIQLQRWQNHMILFTHQIDLGDLKTRATVKKKVETRNGQILGFVITVLKDGEIKFGNKLIKSISQHYLILSSLKVNNSKNNQGNKASYFIIRTTNTDYFMPIVNGEICIQLPETLEIQYIQNGQLTAKSNKVQTTSFTNTPSSISLKGIDKNPTCTLEFQLSWGINLHQAKPSNNLLMEAHQLFIYEIQIKFDNYSEYSGSKIKFIYGNKAFDLGFEFNSPKPPKINKILYFIIKSEDEQINVFVERNQKLVAMSKFYTDQVGIFTVGNLKRKFFDLNNRNVGFIKFKCEKGKNLSTPNNNKIWKQNTKNRVTTNMLLSIDQVSVNYAYPTSLSVIVKSESEQKVFENVPNIEYFSKQLQIPINPIMLNTKLDGNIYLIVKQLQNQFISQNNSVNPEKIDFIGIALLNFGDLGLGMNTVEIPFFKNQEKTVSINCLINKIMPYPFIKSQFQSEIIRSHNHNNKTLMLSINVKKVVFSPYYYTYRYENKNQVYCIVQANRLKKVLIMQTSQKNQLLLRPSTNSDVLNFITEDTEFLKIKVFFLVSDIGFEEEIYGSAVLKMKTGEILSAGENGIYFNQVEIKNSFGTSVGKIDVLIQKGNFSKSLSQEKMPTESRVVDYERRQIPKRQNTGPFKSDIKKIQKDISKVNNKMQAMERSIEKKVKSQSQRSVNPIRNNLRYNKDKKYNQKNHSLELKSSRQHQNLILPNIHSKSKNYNQRVNKNSLKDLVQMMKIQKRIKGQNSKDYRKHDSSRIQKQLLEREKPNIEKNIDLLFPNKNKKPKNNHSLDNSVKGLKSVYKEIGEDIQQIQTSHKNDEVRLLEESNLKGPQWDDNQFAM